MPSRLIPLLLLLGALVGCSRSDADGALDNRWYSQRQVNEGYRLYQANCASCHRPDASGTNEWRKPVNGHYPPPPLNGTAHTWHHSLEVLHRTIEQGGVRLGGMMPAFGSRLSAGQIDSLLAWIQSRWPEEVYQIWAKNYPSDAQSTAKQ